MVNQVEAAGAGHWWSSPLHALQTPPDQLGVDFSQVVLGMPQAEKQFAEAGLTCPGVFLFWF